MNDSDEVLTDDPRVNSGINIPEDFQICGIRGTSKSGGNHPHAPEFEIVAGEDVEVEVLAVH